MKIIRDENGLSVSMIALLAAWNINRCNVDTCTNEPSTIAQGLSPEIPIAGFCEEHFQEANAKGGVKFNLIFNDFDAFEFARMESVR